jgi:hypothetical protein
MEYARPRALFANANSSNRPAITKREPVHLRQHRKHAFGKEQNEQSAPSIRERVVRTSVTVQSTTGARDFVNAVRHRRPGSHQKGKQVNENATFSSFEACASHHRKVWQRFCTPELSCVLFGHRSLMSSTVSIRLHEHCIETPLFIFVRFCLACVVLPSASNIKDLSHSRENAH